jgi:[ribosomal protein S5]-alanine N-acetyltransferase
MLFGAEVGRECGPAAEPPPVGGRRREVGLPETLRTDRLELRRFSLSDGPAVFAYSQDPDWMEYQQTIPASQRDAEGVVAQLVLRDWEERPAWAITRSGGVVGIVGLVFSAGYRVALLGYGIHRDHRGLGLTGEAIETVLTGAFAAHAQLAKVAAHTDARNRSSSRLLEKLGFTREGTSRSGGVSAKGELVDTALYGLLRSEWHARTR